MWDGRRTIDTMAGNNSHVVEWAELVGEDVPESGRRHDGLRRCADQHAE
jgi:hypothetical protein